MIEYRVQNPADAARVEYYIKEEIRRLDKENRYCMEETRLRLNQGRISALERALHRLTGKTLDDN